MEGNKSLNVHPRAWAQEKKMMEDLRESPCYLEGTQILHDWDEKTNEVTWLYRLPQGLDDQETAGLKGVVLRVINKFQQPD